MDTETANKPSTSFDVFALSSQGYEVHVQLSGDRAYASALKLLATMAKDGFKPRPSKPAFTPRAKQDVKGNGADTQVCPVHNAPLKRHENGNGAWFSHKLPDGSWCNGKAA